MATTIEFVQGQENHSSSWGKWYIKGLEAYQVKEEFVENRFDKHHSYQGYVCLDVPDNTIFTVFEMSGDKRGTDDYEFYICVVDESEDVKTWKPAYGKGFINGRFRPIASAVGKTKAPRLLEWWSNSNRHDLAFAEHCAIYIEKRGVKTLPSLE